MLFSMMFLATMLLVYASIQNSAKLRDAAHVLAVLFTLSILMLILQEAPAGSYKLVHDISNVGILVSCMMAGASCGLALYRIAPDTQKYEESGEFTDIGEGG